MLNKGALALINEYGADSSDDDVPGPRVSTKRTFKDDNNDTFSNKRLPLPDILCPVTKEEHIDDAALHGGRQRSFAHERGNWATYVFIPMEQGDAIKDFTNDIVNNNLENLRLNPCDDFHISLTKTVILRHHWITPFVDDVKLKTQHINKFLIMFDNLKIYCNEERTRTFIGLQIKSGYDSLLKLVEILDNCLAEFRLPPFYEDPSFHMSIAWCVGDFEKELNEVLPDLNLKLQDFMDCYSQENWYIYVKSILCKSGNKFFEFHLT